MKRIAISGSNGKSTTALWTAAIDGGDTTAACIWSGGNLLHGQPAQVEKTMSGFLRFDASIEEAGAAALVTEVTSHALERGFTDRRPCDVAVLTNVTHEHHDDHGSQSAYLKAKARLFDALRPGGIAVFTATDERAAQLMENTRHNRSHEQQQQRMSKPHVNPLSPRWGGAASPGAEAEVRFEGPGLPAYQPEQLDRRRRLLIVVRRLPRPLVWTHAARLVRFRASHASGGMTP